MTHVISLGGASAAPRPGQGCSGYLIDGDGTRVVLDLGPGTLPELLRHRPLADLNGILITHMHIDHMLDLFALWWGWLYHANPLATPVPLWLPPGGAESVRRTLSTLGRPDEVERFFGNVCDVAEFDPTRNLTIANTSLSFAQTAHFIPCWAVRVELPSATVAYTADTGPAVDLTELARNVDLLISEAMLPVGSLKDSTNRGSSTPAEAAALARNAQARRLMLAHLWSHDDATAALRVASAIFHGETVIAQPGLSVEL